MKKIAIAGASGFIGSQLIQKLLDDKTNDYQITALSRSEYVSESPSLVFKKANLYSMLELEEAIRDCDCAIYLIHSMSPNSRLAQGSFSDFDFILADNFARVCEKTGIKSIIYVSGMVPQNKKKLSEHLKSRLEVEKVLHSRGANTLTFRCSIVIGAKGSSFKILKNLVNRLYFLGLPSWTRNLTQPIYIDDLTYSIKFAIDHPPSENLSVDLGGPDILSYGDLMKATGKALGKKRIYLSIPFIPVFLSKIWVSLIAGVSRALVYPLIDSLKHEMVAKKDQGKFAAKYISHPNTKVFAAISKSLKPSKSNPYFRRSETKPNSPQEKRPNEVQSVQRLPMPGYKTAKWVAHRYLEWLPTFFQSVINAETHNDICKIYFLFLNRPLLVLEYSKARSTLDRPLFYVKQGLLVSKLSRKGRLEFREDPDKKFIICAIHQFAPSLPWFFYRYTQAITHKFVMYRFGAHIKKYISENQMK